MGAYCFLVWAPSMQQKNFILVVFKFCLVATMTSARRYSGISKYFKNTFPKHLSFCVGPIIPKFAARSSSQTLQAHLGQGRPPFLLPNGVPEFTHPSTNYPFIPWQVDIQDNTDCWSICCSYFLLCRTV